MLFRRGLKKAGKKREPVSGDMGLQITSLADILMIVLIFLLKSVASGLSDQETIKVAGNIKLPTVQNGGGAKDGLKVEISGDKVEVAGQPVAHLQKFRFPASDLNNDMNESSTARSLNSAFRKSFKNEKDEAPIVWIVADQQAPYTTIQTVIASAALQGYQEFKLAVVRGE
jgi:biopolymer transport protein ExbD